MTRVVSARTPEETEAFGELLGRCCVEGTVVALQGVLGAGKTVFAKGVARGLGVTTRYVSSPTFTLHKVYEGRLTLHHLDLYRLSGEGELEALGLDDVLGGSGVCVIEWPDSFFEAIPRDLVVVRFLLTPPAGRKLEIEATGSCGEGVLKHFWEALEFGARGRILDDL